MVRGRAVVRGRERWEGGAQSVERVQMVTGWHAGPRGGPEGPRACGQGREGSEWGLKGEGGKGEEVPGWHPRGPEHRGEEGRGSEQGLRGPEHTGEGKEAEEGVQGGDCEGVG